MNKKVNLIPRAFDPDHAIKLQACGKPFNLSIMSIALVSIRDSKFTFNNIENSNRSLFIVEYIVSSNKFLSEMNRDLYLHMITDGEFIWQLNNGGIAEGDMVSHACFTDIKCTLFPSMEAIKEYANRHHILCGLF